MSKTDLKWFEKELHKRTEEILLQFRHQYTFDEMCGFALYSDESAMSISVSINTYDFLKEKNLKYPGNDSSFKFSPGEWKFEMFYIAAMEELNSFLQEMHFKVDEKEFDTYRRSIYDIAVKVLEQMKKEKMFPINEQFVLLFSVSDYSDSDLEISYVKRLNSMKITDEFEYWIKNEVFDDELDDNEFEEDDFDEGVFDNDK